MSRLSKSNSKPRVRLINNSFTKLPPKTKKHGAHLESPYADSAMMGQRSSSTQKLQEPHMKAHDLVGRIKQVSAKSVLSKPEMMRSKFSVAKPQTLSRTRDDPIAHAKDLEDQLEKQLKTQNSLDAYRQTLAIIAAKDQTFGPLISRIKDFYEEQMNELQAASLFEANERLKGEVKRLNDQIETELTEQKQLERKIEKFARENEDLANDIDDRENRYMEMQDQMLKISTLDLADVPLTEESWQFLVGQSKQFSEACKELKTKNKAYRKHEKQLLKLVLALKKRGIPVEEVYETDVKQASKKKQKPRVYQGNLDDEPVPDDTEGENIVEGSPKMVSRPGFVPSLQLEENFYESSEGSSYAEDSGNYSASQMSAPGFKTN